MPDIKWSVCVNISSLKRPEAWGMGLIIQICKHTPRVRPSVIIPSLRLS